MMSRRTPIALAVVVGLVPATALAVSIAADEPAVAQAPAAPQPKAAFDRFVGKVQVVRDVGARTPTTNAEGEPVLRGVVFEDKDKDSAWQAKDKGVAGVKVSNGIDVVRTDAQGRYELPVRDKMTVFITQPSGYQVPVDSNNVAQFAYNHAPKGTQQKLRFGGIEPSGPLPSMVNFPLAPSKATAADTQRCVAAGDLQTYSGREIGYGRAGGLKHLADRGDLGSCGVLFLGDVAGDDLGLYPRIKEAAGQIDAPLRFVPGNHDLDYDATDDKDSFDTFRQQMGPAYFSYDVGKTHFVGLDNVVFPCKKATDNADGKRPSCDDPAKPVYNGRLTDEQLQWLKNDLANTPKDYQVVLASHIPLVSFADMTSPIHSTDNVKEIWKLLEGRKALSLSGHTHSLENMRAGDSYGPWQKAAGVSTLPFPHIVAGALSGDWYSGDLDVDGLPMATQRDGGRPGHLVLDMKGNEFRETFVVTGEPEQKQMALGINSPHWRSWFTTLSQWRQANPPSAKDLVPPLSYNDLGDPHLVTPQDLAGGSYLTANVWNGTTGSKVEVSIDGGAKAPAQRTQQARGEEYRVGAEWADPYAATRQLSVNRYAQQSTSGDPRSQGYELYRGSKYGPGAARPGNNIADRMSHLWRLPLPANLGRRPPGGGDGDRPARSSLHRDHQLRGRREAPADGVPQGAVHHRRLTIPLCRNRARPP